MKKKLIITAIFVVLGGLIAFLAYNVGKYSHEIGKPKLFHTHREQWLVTRARQHALNSGISADRLTNPRVVDTRKVYFGGQAGLGGVEVTIIEETGTVLEMSY